MQPPPSRSLRHCHYPLLTLLCKGRQPPGTVNFFLFKQVLAMTMAAAIESRTAGAPARSKTGRIARVDIVRNLAEAEPAWRALEDHTHFSTPYQRFDLLCPWQSLVAAREGAKPLIVIAYDGERRPLMLMPLALKREHGVRVARFMGGKHTTFNMALCDKDFAREATAADLADLLTALRAQDIADVLALTQQ